MVVRFLATYMMSVFLYFTDQPVKVDPFINGVKYPVSYWTERGGRPYQEDRHHEMKGTGAQDSSLYGVFDGHGGHRAAQHCKDNLLQCISADAEFGDNPAKALFRSFFKYVCKTVCFITLMEFDLPTYVLLASSCCRRLLTIFIHE